MNDERFTLHLALALVRVGSSKCALANSIMDNFSQRKRRKVEDDDEDDDDYRNNFIENENLDEENVHYNEENYNSEGDSREKAAKIAKYSCGKYITF